MNDGPDTVRVEIQSLLSSGMGTEVYPRADTHEQVQELVRRLQEGAGTFGRSLSSAASP